MTRDGRTVIRGGVGRYVGRVWSYGTLWELQYNGVTGRSRYSRVSVPGFPIDPTDPANTGLFLGQDIVLLDDQAPSPESIQVGLGLSQRLAATGLRLEIDAVWVEGRNLQAIRDDNWRGNDHPCQDDPAALLTCRIDPAYRQITRLTSEGHSRYRAATVAVNGTLSGAHLLTAALTVADKMSTNEPIGGVDNNDPADLDAEWGRGVTDERYRLVISGVFHFPWRLTVAPIYEYGSGLPWTHVLGYDANHDLMSGNDRPDGVARNDQDGPRFSQLSLRLAKGFDLGQGELELVLEVFNLLDTTNYDINSVVNTEYLVGPSADFPDGIPNPDFGTYTATLPPREIQLGVRYSF
jgi:hypothetical protein